MELILIRHGQTEWNRLGLKQGQHNSNLTALGLQQAEALATALAHKFDDIHAYDWYVSPLGRTKDYAHRVAEVLKTSPKMRYSDQLMENSFGIWEGLSEEDIEAKFPGQLAARKADHWFYRVPSGESYDDVFARVQTFINALDPSGKYIIVTHEVVSKCITGHMTDLSRENITKMRHPNNVYFHFKNQKMEQHDFCAA